MENIQASNFMLALDRITKNTKRVIDSVLRKHGLRSTHASCFFRICEDQNGMTSTELAEACGVDKAFISRITTQLSNDGYITKAPGTTGLIYKRKFILTEKGNSVYDELKLALADVVINASKEIPEGNLQIFDQVLNILDKNLIDSVKGGLN